MPLEEGMVVSKACRHVAMSANTLRASHGMLLGSLWGDFNANAQPSCKRSEGGRSKQQCPRWTSTTASLRLGTTCSYMPKLRLHLAVQGDLTQVWCGEWRHCEPEQHART